MHRTTWRQASRAAASVLAVTAVYGATSAVAQTGTKAQATSTSPTEVVSTGPTIIKTGSENVPSPGNNDCYARLFKPKADGIPEEFLSDDSVVVQYRIRCSSPMTAFTLGFNGRESDGIEAEIPVTYYSGNGITKDQSFNCSGDTPGLGIACVGTYSGGYNTIRGLVSLQLTAAEVKKKTSFCKLGLRGALSTFTSQYDRDQFTNKLKNTKTVDGTATVTTPVIANFASGPIRATTPQCHRGAKKS